MKHPVPAASERYTVKAQKLRAEAARPKERAGTPLPGPMAKRGRGRPPRLSREAIAQAALALIQSEPQKPLTMARVAARVDAVPAALYRHFANLDDLLDGVLGLVLGSLEPQITARSRWPEQVRSWMFSLREHLLRFPSVLPLIGRHGRTSPAWLDAVATLAGILEGMGLRGGTLARAHLWILETTIGIVMQEASLPIPDQIEGARQSLAEMSEAGRTRLAPVVQQLARIDGDTFFAFVVDRTIDGLSQILKSALNSR